MVTHATDVEHPLGISLASAAEPASRARSWHVGRHEGRGLQPLPYFCTTQVRQVEHACAIG